MRVLDIIRSDRVTVSCELFPPKLGKPLRDTERIVDLCQYFGQKKLKYYADFFSSSSSLCCGVI